MSRGPGSATFCGRRRGARNRRTADFRDPTRCSSLSPWNGDYPELAGLHLNRALPRNPHVPPKMVFHLGEIMMAVDALLRDGLFMAAFAEHGVRKLGHSPVHHLFAIGERIILGPKQVPDIVLEFLCFFRKVC